MWNNNDNLYLIVNDIKLMCPRYDNKIKWANTVFYRAVYLSSSLFRSPPNECLNEFANRTVIS